MRLLWFNLATDLDDPILGFTTAWVRAVAERVEHIDVITMRAGRVEVPDNVRVHSLGKELGHSEPRRAAEFYRVLATIFRARRPDACFSHMTPIFTVLAAPVLKMARVPIVTWYTHPSVTTTLKAAHHLSDAVATGFPTSYPYRKDRLVVLGHGIDTAHFSPADDVVKEQPPLVLSVGRLSPVKDQLTLVEAVAQLRDREGAPLRVALVGGTATDRDQQYVETLRSRVGILGLGGIVSLPGAVPLDSLPAWYRRASIHVNLTPPGSGDKSALEAMACGLPSLVANPGFAETLGEHADALTFRHGDAEHLTERLSDILRRPAVERRHIGQSLRQRVVERHSLAKMSAKIVALLREHSTRGRVA